MFDCVQAVVALSTEWILHILGLNGGPARSPSHVQLENIHIYACTRRGSYVEKCGSGAAIVFRRMPLMLIHVIIMGARKHTRMTGSEADNDDNGIMGFRMIQFYAVLGSCSSLLSAAETKGGH